MQVVNADMFITSRASVLSCGGHNIARPHLRRYLRKDEGLGTTEYLSGNLSLKHLNTSIQCGHHTEELKLKH